MPYSVSVFQDWLFGLPFQQQTVLVCAGRGPDGVGKFHPAKQILARYRATIFRQAYSGRVMNIDEPHSTTFMSLQHFSNDRAWGELAGLWFEYIDSMPYHFCLHFMHGAEICGYKHPHELFRRRWGSFYVLSCEHMHLTPESEEEMDVRLNDWGRQHWEEAE